MQLHVRLLGGLEVEVDGARVDQAAWSRRSAAQLVQLLALAPGHRLHREQVLDALWPELASMTELAPRLHKAAHFARRALGTQDGVVLSGSTVQLGPGATVVVDAAQFEARATAAMTHGDAQAAREVAALYTGDLLPESPYEGWLAAPREHLRGLYLDVLRLGELWPALAEADPTSERAHLELARAAALAGDVSGAIRQLEHLERAMDRDLGIAPSKAVVELRDRLMAEAQRRVPAVEHPLRLPLRTTTVPVGRQQEAARIERLLTDVGFGHGQALFVVGARGMGCSFFLTYLEHEATARGMRVGSGSLAQTRAPWPYAPVLDALSHLCRGDPTLLESLDATARATLQRAMAARELDWDGSSTHQHLYVAAAELLRLAAQGAGALLVVDDIDDADEASLELFHYLTRATAGTRVLLATAILPDVRESVARVRAGLEARDQATVIDLHPLDRQHAAELLAEYVSDPQVIETLASAVVGVPYDLVEAATAAARGEADPVRALLPFEPESPLGSLLEAAALSGRTFDADEVAAVVGLDGATAFGLVEEAVSRGILMRDGVVPTFHHELIRESVLHRIPPERRREWHTRYADVLRDTDAPASCVAHHLLEAGKAADAVEWVLRASQTDAALGAYRNALERLDRIRHVEHGPSAARLALLRADVLGALADPAALDAYREALELATDAPGGTKVRVRLARAALFLGELDTARTALDGLELAGLDQADDALHLLVQGHVHLFAGDLDGAQHSADEARRRIAISPRASAAAFELVTFDGLLAHRSGKWFHRLRQALRRGAEQPDLATGLFDSHLCVAEYLLYGPTPYEEIRELAHNLRESARRSGVTRAVAFAAALGGEAALLAGDLEVARRELEEAVALHRQTTSMLGEAHSMQRLAETHLALGDKEQANRILASALPLARWSTFAGCLLPRVFGAQVLAAPNPVAAVAVVDEATASLGVEDHCSFCSIAFDAPAARALAATGDLTGARTYLVAAQASADLWQTPAWRAAVLEARAAIATAQDDAETARELLRQAADTYAASGQVLDARRCAELVST